MSRSLNITIIQANFTIGAIKNNLAKIISIYNQITQTTNEIIPNLLVFSELSITGYPAEDLYLQSSFQQQAESALEELKDITKEKSCAILIGNIDNRLVNAAYLISHGNIQHVASKKNLPNYGVFDEQRYFVEEDKNDILEFNGYKLGILICEDIWTEELPNRLCQQGAEILISINASPFHIHKDKERKQLVKNICKQNQVDLVYVNQVGGQDELIFDGGSFVCNTKGEIKVQLDYFVEAQSNITWQQNQIITNFIAKTPTEVESIYKAMMLGLSDYLHKNGFQKILLGLSGGIDSALTAAIAVDALGAENVMAVMLPSQYTSESSTADAINLARLLNIELLDLPIEPLASLTRSTLSNDIATFPASSLASLEEARPGISNAFGVSVRDDAKNTITSLTDQNIQARIRGLLLMALSNQYGSLLLSTGNKSENAVGYATLYGDMCGGYNVLKDIYKTQVYQLAKWRKIPQTIIDKAPSAELCANQKDQDTLPDYDLLDQILYHLIEDNLSIKEVSAKGFDLQIVQRVFNLVKKSEYKRRQSCPGPIISTCSLSKNRRYPMTNYFQN